MASREREGWLESPVVSVLAGPALAAVFLGIVRLLPAPQLHRYFLGHPICMAITGLFFVAAAALWQVWRKNRRDQWIVDSLQPSALCPRNLIDAHVTIAART